MAAASAASNGGKRGRSEPGRVGVYKWYRIFPVSSVGTGKEEYDWRFPSFSETFRWNELYHLNSQPEISIFVDKMVNAPVLSPTDLGSAKSLGLPCPIY